MVERLAVSRCHADVEELRRELSLLTSPFENVKSFQIRLKTDVDPTSDELIDSSFEAVAEVEADFKFANSASIRITVVDRDLKGRQSQGHMKLY